MNRRSFLQLMGTAVALPLVPKIVLASDVELSPVVAGRTVLLASIYAQGDFFFNWWTHPGNEIVFPSGTLFGMSFDELSMTIKRDGINLLKFAVRNLKYLTLIAEHGDRQFAIMLERDRQPRIEWVEAYDVQRLRLRE